MQEQMDLAVAATCEGPMLEQSGPEGLHLMVQTHMGAVLEEL